MLGDMKPRLDIRTDQPVEPSPETHVEMLRQELLHPPAGDKVMAACSLAIAHLLPEPSVRDRFVDYFQDRLVRLPEEHLPTWAAAHMSRTAAHQGRIKELSAQGLSYGEADESPETWDEYLRRIWNTHRPFNQTIDGLDDYSYPMKIFELQTTKPKRYATLQWLGHLCRERFQGPLNILDVGPSRGDGLKMLALGMPVGHIAVHGTDNDELNTTRVNDLLHVPLPDVGTFHGIEKWPILQRDALRTEWFKSNYLRPIDLKDPERVRLYYELEPDIPGVIIEQGDFARDTPPELHHRHTGQTVYDIVFYSTVLYQMKEEQRIRMFKNGLKRIHPDRGLLVVQDYLSINEEDPFELDFHDQLDEKYKYRTVAIDLSSDEEREKGFQELIRWEDGSCNAMQFGNSDLSRRLWANAGILLTQQAAEAPVRPDEHTAS